MKTYKKRIAFLISDQHFHAHGGIGSFAKSFTEMCQRIDWKVDIILDKKPRHDNFVDIIERAGANIVYSDNCASYGKHNNFFQNGDTLNSDKISNFRDSIIQALQKNMYDMYVVNTQEAMTAAYSFSFDEYVPVVFYTHLHSMIYREAQNFTSDVFLPNYHHFFNKHMEFPNAIIGTQSEKNVTELTKYGSKNCALLRMPMSERSLLEQYQGEKAGVLFIGRWEEGKNPEAYVRVMKESNLPCKVMTSETSVKKFKEAFKQAGVTDFVIKADISGQEKVNFIRSSKVFFMPSLRENYPFAFIECVGHMPTVVLDKQDWSTNFDQKYFFVEPLQNVATLIKQLYDSTGNYYDTGALDYIKSLDDNIANAWINFLAEFESSSKKSNSNTAQIHSIIDSKTTIRYDEFFKNDLARSSVNRNDCVSFFGNRHKYNTVYTDQFTYLSKDNHFMPADSDVQSVGLFEGL
jgi:glycosyltransferase involved in cell wall biosynthesis